LNQLMTEMKKRKDYLNRLIVYVKRQLKSMPPGYLRISSNRGIPRYYHITKPKDTSGKYIRKENMDIVKKLAQKDYLNKVLKQAEAELININIFLENNQSNHLENIYTITNDYRKNLITPLVVPDEVYVQQWEEESYETNPTYKDLKVYPTKNNELVQSKSEAFLADMYFDLGIPYRYDAALRLKSGVIKFPDFTLLDIRNRRIIYHEHFGLMDDDEYRRKNLRKLDEYRRNGIYPGKNMIVTYEADGCPFNIREIRQMIEEMFGVS